MRAQVAPDLRFDAEKHQYFVGGQRVPSVTQVLGYFEDSMRHVDPDLLERASDFGKKVHRASALDDLNDLLEASLDPKIAEYLEGWRKFKRDVQFVPELIEQKLYHVTHRCAGTLDRVGSMGGRRALIDLKTGVPTRSAGPQTAAYNLMLEPNGYRSASARYSVHLKPNGYKLIPHRDDSDLTVFLSALTLWRWLHPKGDYP